MERRELCPDRILTDTGGAFAMGAVGGSAFHFIKGLRNSPNGTRIAGGLDAMRNVPRLAGSFAVWGGVFSACDCALVYLRQKEDPWNSIISGAAAGGILSVRQGLRAVVGSSVQGAVLLALLCGTGLMGEHKPPPSNISMPVNSPEISSGGELFGKRKVEDGAANWSKTDTFETSDVPSTSMPPSEYK